MSSIPIHGSRLHLTPSAAPEAKADNMWNTQAGLLGRGIAQNISCRDLGQQCSSILRLTFFFPEVLLAVFEDLEANVFDSISCTAPWKQLFGLLGSFFGNKDAIIHFTIPSGAAPCLAIFKCISFLVKSACPNYIYIYIYIKFFILFIYHESLS